MSNCHRSVALDGVTGALPAESGFVNGQVGVRAITDTLTFGQASKTGTVIVTLPDGVTKVTLPIAIAPRTAVEMASAFQSTLPNGWNLISQIGGAVTSPVQIKLVNHLLLSILFPGPCQLKVVSRMVVADLFQ